MAVTIEMDQTFLSERGDFQRARAKLLWAMRELSRPALMRIAKVVETAARTNAEESKRTGLLQSSIVGKVRKLRGGDGLQAYISTNTKGKWKTKEYHWRTKRGEELTIRKQVPVKYGYGLDVERGRPSGNYRFTPYLRPALSDSFSEVVRIYREEFAKAAASSVPPAPAVGTYANVEIPVLGREIIVGAKGGRYYVNDAGNRTYIK